MYSTPPIPYGIPRNDFEAWTKSEAFRKAHSGAGNRGHLYLGHPEFEGFEVVDGATVG